MKYFKFPIEAETRLFCSCQPGKKCSCNSPGIIPKMSSVPVEAALKTAKAFGCAISSEFHVFRRMKSSFMQRYTSPLGTGGSLKDLNLAAKEVRLEESPDGSAVCSIATGGDGSRLKPLLSYIGVLGKGQTEACSDNYAEDFAEPFISATATSVYSVSVPELPFRRIEKWTGLGIGEDSAAFIASDRAMADAFDALAAGDFSSYARFFFVNLKNALEQSSTSFGKSMLSHENLKNVFQELQSGSISERKAEELLVQMIARPKESDIIMKRKNVRKITSEHHLRQLISKVVIDNPLMVVEWRSGRVSIGKIMAKAMLEAQNRADPVVLRKLLEERLRGNE